MPEYLKILKPFEKEFILKYAQTDEDRFYMTAQHLINNSIMRNMNEAIHWKNILLQYASTKEMKEYVEALI